MTRRLAAATLAALLAATAPAPARTMQQRLEQACAAPIAALCPGARTDADTLNACLAAHHAELPPDCARLVDIAG